MFWACGWGGGGWGGGRRCRFGNPRSVTITMRSPMWKCSPTQPLDKLYTTPSRDVSPLVAQAKKYHQRWPCPERSEAFKGVSQFEWAPLLDSVYGDVGWNTSNYFICIEKHYTSTKSFTISVIIVMGGTKTPPLLKMERGQTLFLSKINSYLVAYHWKGRFNTKVMTRRKGFYDIPG